MNDLMIDIETLSTASDAAIMAIAAVPFSRLDGPHPSYYCWKISLESAIQHGSLEADTIEFWINRGPILQNECSEALGNVLSDLSSIIGDDTKVWSKGPGFDMAILKSAFRSCNIPIGWKYYNERCVRTVMDLAGLKSKDIELPVGFIHDFGKHDPIYDCYMQVEAVVKSLQIINESSIR